MTLSEKEFSDEMNRLTERFPGASNKQLLQRIRIYVKDLPSNALSDIVNGFLDNFKAQPLPNDFEKAASDWRRQYFLKTGIYFGESKADESPVIDCTACQDLGIIKAKEDKLLLFRCTCEKGKREMSKIPMYESELKQAYETEACPSEWFVPKGWADRTFDHGALLGRMHEWKEYLRLSENKWESLGYLYEESKDRYGARNE